MNILYIDNTISEEGTTWTFTALDEDGIGTGFINDYGSGVLAYNPMLNLYIGKYTNPLRPLVYLPEKQIQYRAAVHDASKTIYWLLPMMATSSILLSIHSPSLGKDVTLPNLWNEHTITVDAYNNNKDKYEGYKHVAPVYDPRERFMNWINFLYINGAMDYYLQQAVPESRMHELADVKTAAWHMLAVAKLVNENPTFDTANELLSETHMLTQLPPIDVLVPLPRTDYYLQEEMGLLAIHGSMTTDRKVWLGGIEGLADQLKEIYKDDFELLKDKRVWTQKQN